MRISVRLNKPEYWFQPRQLFRKMLLELGRHSSATSTHVHLPWGVKIAVNSRDSIGKSLISSGVYDLAVSEVLWRLTDPGDHCLDIGANIGYMTSLFAVRAGESGRIFSFEPHPGVFSRLQANVQSWYGSGISRKRSPVSLNQLAVGSSNCEMDLLEPEGFEENESSATLISAGRQSAFNGARHRVRVRCLDAFLQEARQFGVMKVDVEGAELAVLEGASGLLAGRKIRDIIYEDFQPFPSGCIALLRRHGYAIFRIAKAILGPVVWDPSDHCVVDRSPPWEPINYLGTVNPDRAQARLRPRGWLCLRAGE